MTPVSAARETDIQSFLKAAGWGAAIRQPLSGDASTRRYERLHLGGRTALLMDQPQETETAGGGPEASEAERRSLGYNAVARLAGADCRAFAAIADELRRRGLSAPHLHAFDFPSGLLLLEDYGDTLFKPVLVRGADEATLYRAAVEVLVHLMAEPVADRLPLPDGSAYPLLGYDRMALLAEAELLPEWYIPAARGRSLGNAERSALSAAWAQVISASGADDPARTVPVLRDYHAENLFWLPGREGLARVGLIDFQDGLQGHPAYDLISLLEDARRDVAPELAAAMTGHFVKTARGRNSAFDEEGFRAAAAVLAAQRNAKIVGIFTRLWQRDGKPAYPALVPRVWRYLERDLAHPALAPVKAVLDDLIPARFRGDPMRLTQARGANDKDVY